MNFLNLIKQSFLLRLSLALTLITIIFFIAGIFIIIPVTKESQTKRAILNSRENIQLNFEQVLELYTREYETLRIELDKLLPPKENIIEIIEVIENEGVKLGIKPNINNIPTDEPTKTNIIRYLITFSGNSDQLTNYIDHLNKLNFYIEIQKISSTEVDKFSFDKIANHQIVLDVFTR